MSQETSGRWPLIGGVIAAVAASLCCVGPLVLVMLGVGGAWVGNLAVLEPFRPYFLGAALIALFFAWKKIYRAPTADACTPGSLCALPQTNRIYKVLFWIVAALIALALVFPYLAPLFY
jgi:mercuric ion transport protein